MGGVPERGPGVFEGQGPLLIPPHERIASEVFHGNRRENSPQFLRPTGGIMGLAIAPPQGVFCAPGGGISLAGVRAFGTNYPPEAGENTPPACTHAGGYFVRRAARLGHPYYRAPQRGPLDGSARGICAVSARKIPPNYSRGTCTPREGILAGGLHGSRAHFRTPKIASLGGICPNPCQAHITTEFPC